MYAIIPHDVLNVILMKSCELVVSERLQNGWLVINQHIKYLANSLKLLNIIQPIKSSYINQVAKLIDAFGKPPENKTELQLKITLNEYMLAFNL
jgi:hypothetical protein